MYIYIYIYIYINTHLYAHTRTHAVSLSVSHTRTLHKRYSLRVGLYVQTHNLCVHKLTYMHVHVNHVCTFVFMNEYLRGQYIQVFILAVAYIK